MSKRRHKARRAQPVSVTGSSLGPNLLIAGLILIACLRIAATYSVFTQTADEPLHVSAGLQMLTHGVYEQEAEHPPLARLAAAAGPYLDGLRIKRSYGLREAYEVFHLGSDYFREVSLARLGILPFFVLASLVVAVWTWRLHGPVAAVLATLLFTTLPPILGHAGLATTDMAAAAGVILGLYAWWRWLEKPDLSRSLWVGLSLAIALLSKFSVIPFLLPSMLAAAGFRYREDVPSQVRSWVWLGTRLKTLLPAAATCFILVWAGYGFAVDTLPPPGESAALREIRWPLTLIRDFGLRNPIPAPRFLLGIAEVLSHNRGGHDAFLLGQTSRTGWWYFFPVVFALKTPIAFLILAAASIHLLRVRRAASAAWLPLLAAAVVMGVGMASRINIGVRHILPIYPFLAIAAGAAAAQVLRRGQLRAVRFAAIALLVWQAGASILAHPDYFPYFNELAGPHPERIRNDSDLDWDQDYARLEKSFEALDVEESAGIAPFETSLPLRHRTVGTVGPYTPAIGWFAVRATELGQAWYAPPGPNGERPWQWLEKYKPVERVGYTIFIYNVPPR